MKIYFDSLQEGTWFKTLNPSLTTAALHPFPKANNVPTHLRQVLSYDRPDIILVDRNNPILVVERTIEVPSGHNVGQRFARLVAAAQLRIPVVYFGPYAAYKHGGKTRGPRYMNLRLFYALENMARIEKSAITTINWPVDAKYEIRRDGSKDERIKKYLALFFQLYETHDFSVLPDQLMNSNFEKEQESERDTFISEEVEDPQQYDGPPDSVTISPWKSIAVLANHSPKNLQCASTVFYKVGMTYIRSDPYTGMALLYSYLYCGGMKNRVQNLVLYFPNITAREWDKASKTGNRKDIRLFRMAADGIVFSNDYRPKELL